MISFFLPNKDLASLRRTLDLANEICAITCLTVTQDATTGQYFLVNKTTDIHGVTELIIQFKITNYRTDQKKRK